MVDDSVKSSVLISLLSLSKDREPTIAEVASFSLVSESLVKQIILKHGIRLSDGRIRLTSIDKVKLGISLIKSGIPPDRFSRFLSWRDFEDFVSNCASILGYDVVKNLNFIYFRKRYQIDILAITNGLIIAIDCKRWKRLNNKSLPDVVHLQVERVKKLSMLLGSSIGYGDAKLTLLPAILTIYEPPCRSIDKVPIIPVSLLRSFLGSLSCFLEEFYTISVNLRKLPTAKGFYSCNYKGIRSSTYVTLTDSLDKHI